MVSLFSVREEKDPVTVSGFSFFHFLCVMKSIVGWDGM